MPSHCLPAASFRVSPIFECASLPAVAISLRLPAAIVSSHRLKFSLGREKKFGLTLNDAAGKQWLGIKLDPYERSFRIVRTHVLIKKDRALTRESLLEAISQGHCYLSFDIFGDAKGFSFAASGLENTIMGDQIELLPGGLHLTTGAPLTGRFVL